MEGQTWVMMRMDPGKTRELMSKAKLRAGEHQTVYRKLAVQPWPVLGKQRDTRLKRGFNFQLRTRAEGFGNVQFST